jgi:hypothetical protein
MKVYGGHTFVRGDTRYNKGNGHGHLEKPGVIWTFFYLKGWGVSHFNASRAFPVMDL